MISLDFEVVGPPVPKSRARRGIGKRDEFTGKPAFRWFTPDKTRAYEARVFSAALAARLLWEKMHLSKWPTGLRYILRYAVFVKKSPRFDMDNVGKSLLDGCNPRNGLKTFWDDDRQAICVPIGFPTVDPSLKNELVAISVEVVS